MNLGCRSTKVKVGKVSVVACWLYLYSGSLIGEVSGALDGRTKGFRERRRQSGSCEFLPPVSVSHHGSNVAVTVDRKHVLIFSVCSFFPRRHVPVTPCFWPRRLAFLLGCSLGREAVLWDVSVAANGKCALCSFMVGGSLPGSCGSM